MRRLCLYLLGFLLLVHPDVSAKDASVSFAKFKFQPDKTYMIDVSQSTTVTSSLGESPGGEASESIAALFKEVKQSLSMKLFLQTFPITSEGNLPIRLRFGGMDIEMESGGKELPIPLDEKQLRSLEYQGSLDESGEVRISGGSASLSRFQAQGIDVMQILSLIPDLPEGDHRQGEEFSQAIAAPPGALRTSWGRSGPATIIYRISKVEGDNVYLDARVNSKIEDDSGGATMESAVGGTGSIVYSLEEKICKSLEADLVVNTVWKAGRDDPSGRRAVVSKNHLEVKVSETK